MDNKSLVVARMQPRKGSLACVGEIPRGLKRANPLPRGKACANFLATSRPPDSRRVLVLYRRTPAHLHGPSSIGKLLLLLCTESIDRTPIRRHIV